MQGCMQSGTRAKGAHAGGAVLQVPGTFVDIPGAGSLGQIQEAQGIMWSFLIGVQASSASFCKAE